MSSLTVGIRCYVSLSLSRILIRSSYVGVAINDCIVIATVSLLFPVGIRESFAAVSGNDAESRLGFLVLPVAILIFISRRIKLPLTFMSSRSIEATLYITYNSHSGLPSFLRTREEK